MLPKYFAVYNNGTSLFDRFLSELNRTYGTNWSGSRVDTWYGYDGNWGPTSGTDNFKRLEHFASNVEPLTPEQYFELSGKNPESHLSDSQFAEYQTRHAELAADKKTDL